MKKSTYFRMSKISDCIGREDYITSANRQEKLLFSLSNVDKEYWKSLQYESELVVAREIIIDIPNEYKNNEDRIKKFIGDYINDFYARNNCDYVIGVHDNPGNLHAHLMFSERALEHPENEPKLTEKTTRARYKVNGKQVSKKVYDQAVEDGIEDVEYQPKKTIIEVENKRFSNKEKKYESNTWLEEEKQFYTDFKNTQEDNAHEWFAGVISGHLAQVHIGKGDPEKYAGIQAKIDFNKAIVERNELYDEAEKYNCEALFDGDSHIKNPSQLDELKARIEVYRSVWNEIITKIKEIDLTPVTDPIYKVFESLKKHLKQYLYNAKHIKTLKDDNDEDKKNMHFWNKKETEERIKKRDEAIVNKEVEQALLKLNIDKENKALNDVVTNKKILAVINDGNIDIQKNKMIKADLNELEIKYGKCTSYEEKAPEQAQNSLLEDIEKRGTSTLKTLEEQRTRKKNYNKSWDD